MRDLNSDKQNALNIKKQHVQRIVEKRQEDINQIICECIPTNMAKQIAFGSW